MHLFFGCDLVVFVEGGEPVSFDEAVAGKSSDSSIDVKFWERIFSVYSVTKKCVFRALGSKPTLKLIAHDVSQAKISNVLVAMDRDHEPHLGDKIDFPKVLYTCGYSWENDAWTPHAIQALLESLLSSNQIKEDTKLKLRKMFIAFEDEIEQLVKADIILAQNGDSLIPRKSGDELIHSQDGEPCLNIARARELLNQKQNLNVEEGQLDIRPIRDCYGKVVASFGYRILLNVLKEKKVKDKFPKDLANRLMIDKLSKDKMPKSVYRYYESSISNLLYTL